MTVRVEKHEAITTVILDRPEARNAVDGPTAEALSAAFLEFDADETAKVAVLWGDHGSFCAGADLKTLGGAQQNRLEPTGAGPMGPTRMRLSKPCIAAISGFAVAGGLELALWCDLRVAEKDAQLGVFCRRWGVPLIDGGSVRLPRLIGRSRALDLILTGRAVKADEALAMGLVNRVVETGQARAAAEQLARQLAAFPQTCLRQDRLSCLKQEALDFDEAMAQEFEMGLKSLADSEMSSAVGRFKAGRGRHGTFQDHSQD